MKYCALAKWRIFTISWNPQHSRKRELEDDGSQNAKLRDYRRVSPQTSLTLLMAGPMSVKVF